MDCLKATFTEYNNNKYVSRCKRSQRCGEKPSRSYGITSACAGTNHNNLKDKIETIDPKSIKNANAVIKANIIRSASKKGLRGKSKKCERYNPSTYDNKRNQTSSSPNNNKTKSEKSQRKDKSGKNEKRIIHTVQNTSNKKRKVSKKTIVSNTAVKGDDLDLSEEYSSMLKKYEEMFELPPITKNHPRCPLDYDRGYWKALKMYVKSKDDMSLANRYV